MTPTQHHTLTFSTFFKCVFCLLLLLQLAGQANCHPTIPWVSNRRVRSQKQDEHSRRETVQTENIINMLGVAVVERCKLSFTPMSMHDVPAVQIVKSCTFEPVSGASGDSTGQCGPIPPTVTVTSTSTGVPPTSTAATSSNTTSVSTIVNISSSTLSDTFTSSVSGSTSRTTIVSQPTTSPVTNATTTAPSASLPITLSFTSFPGASNTGSSQTSAPSTTSSTSSPSTATTSSPLSYNPSSSLPLSPTSASAQTPQSIIITSTTSLPGMTSPANNVASAPPQQSSALPKVIGAFAGVAVLLLIIGGTIGYLKMKKLNKKQEPISWPIT